jgi:protein-disulfide isomerase
MPEAETLSITRRKFNAVLIAIAAAACFSLTGPASAQQADATELAKPAPLGDIVLGSANAPVTMIEYASLSCGHCAAFHTGVFPALKAEYIDTGKLRYIFREYPLDLQAAAASMVARCIGKGDAQTYHDVAGKLFATQDQWVQRDTAEQLRRIAGEAGLDDGAFNACLGNQAMVDALKLGMEQANSKLKVESTPTFFVNGTQLKGSWSIDEFRKLIESKLKS